MPKPVTSKVLPGQSSSRLHLKFLQGLDIRLRGSRFASQRGVDLSALDGLLGRNVGTRVQRLFDRPEAELEAERQRVEVRSKREQADKNLYYRVILPAGADAAAVLDELNSFEIVEIAYPEPLPAPSPVSPDYVAQQDYRESAPLGIGMDAVEAMPGGHGENAKIVDIEYSWNTDHEDLSRARAAGALRPNKTPVDPFASNAHGTAVLGELVGDDNGFGVTGLSPLSPVEVTNANNAEDGYDLADSIDIAQSNSAPGDVILLEQQATGPKGGSLYVPVEWVPAFYDAIVSATSAGIHVVEAAGNGGQNLDESVYGAPFPNGRADSGAIIVGANSGCGNLGRAAFSTFGSRVNMQGWGGCVVTAGYGDLYSASGPNGHYTGGFNGTSSASPIVAGAVAVLSSIAQAQGLLLTPAQARSTLVATGTPQDPTFDSGHIGPAPNMPAAVGAISGADASAPAVTVLSPAAGATGASVASDVRADFNEAVTGVSVMAFRLTTSAGTPVAASVGYNATLRRAWLNPGASLAPNQTYVATLTGGASAIRDLAGNPFVTTSWSFTTADDTSAPTVTSRTPFRGATGVSRTANVTVKFNEAVTGVAGTTFRLQNAATGAYVAAVVSRNEATNRWTLTPDVTMAARSRYTAILTGGSSAIRDLSGNPLASTTWTFTTGS